MLVSNLQQFLRTLSQPLAALGISQAAEKSVAGGLNTLAEALEPFHTLSTDQLAELLRVAEHYRGTGELPDWILGKKPAVPKPRAPRTPKAPKLTPAEVVTRLRGLQDQAKSLAPERISEEVRGFSALSVNELKDVQREFLGTVVGKKKDELLAALEKKIHDFRESSERVEGILLH
jgi:hypothetical protein